MPSENPPTRIDSSIAIDAIVNLAMEEQDRATFNFGQSFVREQIEEEALVNELLNKLNFATHGHILATDLFEIERGAL